MEVVEGLVVRGAPPGTKCKGGRVVRVLRLLGSEQLYERPRLALSAWPSAELQHARAQQRPDQAPLDPHGGLGNCFFFFFPPL
jgi:hypothetical protein